MLYVSLCFSTRLGKTIGRNCFQFSHETWYMYRTLSNVRLKMLINFIVKNRNKIEIIVKCFQHSWVNGSFSGENARWFTLNVSVQSFNHVSTSMDRIIISKRTKNYHRSAPIRFGVSIVTISWALVAELRKGTSFQRRTSFMNPSSKSILEASLVTLPPPQLFRMIWNPLGKMALASQIRYVR